ncbi:hypothetical protein ACFLU5_16365 [Bacteroidota bacterium]
MIYSFGFAQNPFEITDLTLASERAIHRSTFEYSKTDTFSYDLRIAYTENNKPKFYYTDLVTPVCESGGCLLVTVKTYWDLVGTYLNFQLPPDRFLTKIDHEHFEAADYEKLDRILSDPQWPLAGYSISELIVDSTKSLVDREIDAYTGATAPFVREQDNISGALYTIYTLWEFVHDEEIVNNLQSNTFSLTEDENVRLTDFLSSDRESYWKWAIEHLDSSQIDDNTNLLLLNITRNADHYLGFEALKWINANTLVMQKQLWEVFKEVSFYKKRDIIDKLLEHKIKDQVLIEVINYLPKSNNPMESLLIKKLIDQNKPWSDNVMKSVDTDGLKIINDG